MGRTSKPDIFLVQMSSEKSSIPYNRQNRVRAIATVANAAVLPLNLSSKSQNIFSRDCNNRALEWHNLY